MFAHRQIDQSPLPDMTPCLQGLKDAERIAAEG